MATKLPADPVPLRMGQLLEPFVKLAKIEYGTNPMPGHSTLLKQAVLRDMQRRVKTLNPKQRAEVGELPDLNGHKDEHGEGQTKQVHGREAARKIASRPAASGRHARASAGGRSARRATAKAH